MNGHPCEVVACFGEAFKVVFAFETVNSFLCSELLHEVLLARQRILIDREIHIKPVVTGIHCQTLVVCVKSPNGQNMLTDCEVGRKDKLGIKNLRSLVNACSLYLRVQSTIHIYTNPNIAYGLSSEIVYRIPVFHGLTGFEPVFIHSSHIEHLHVISQEVVVLKDELDTQVAEIACFIKLGKLISTSIIDIGV